jgi:hypothetical protein
VLTVAFAVESAGGGPRFLYTIGAADHRDLSPLRYTALTAALGWPAIAAATLVGTAAGWLSAPSGGDWVAVIPELAYLALPGAVIAVLCWNAAVERLGRRRPRCSET